MLTFFSRKPKKDEPAEVLKTPEAPKEVPYDPGLIAALTHQHRDFVRLLQEVRTAAQVGQFDVVKITLEQLKDGLAGHLLREQLELHLYLIAHIKGEDRMAVLKDMRASAVQVGQSVEGFLKHYTGYPVSARNAGMFDSEIDGVTEEFCRRTEHEEASIYTLYLPPETV